MNGNDISSSAFMPKLRDLFLATALLSRLPLPSQAFSPNDPRPAAHAAWAYPLVGLIVGGVCVAAAWSALALGLPASVAALFAILTGVLITGAMHEDGLADCADGFWGGWTQERRLEIMKDSQIGTYGVIALICALGLRWIALTALLGADSFGAALLAAAVVSRAAMVAVMHALPHARNSGLSHQTGTPPRGALWLALAIGATAVWLVLPAPLFAGAIVAVGVTLGAARIAKAKIKGQTGDVLGATQQLVEVGVLLTCLGTLT